MLIEGAKERAVNEEHFLLRSEKQKLQKADTGGIRTLAPVREPGNVC